MTGKLSVYRWRQSSSASANVKPEVLLSTEVPRIFFAQRRVAWGKCGNSEWGFAGLPGVDDVLELASDLVTLQTRGHCVAADPVATGRPLFNILAGVNQQKAVWRDAEQTLTTAWGRSSIG